MAVAFCDVHVRRGGRDVVRGFSWVLPASGWVGLVGANGSGKTSLLKAVAGRADLSGGAVSRDGTMLSTPYQRARSISLAPDVAAMPSSLSAGELIALFRAEGGEAEGAGAIAVALGIARLSDLRIGAMSAGMRQRVAIYLAFLTQAELIVLDEPFNWLDPIASYDLKTALRTFASTGRHCVLTALHDIASFTTWCDRGALMRDGAMAWELQEHDVLRGRADLPAFERALIDRLRPV